MGKANFAEIYKVAKAASGINSFSIRLSLYCDIFTNDPKGNYAGLIMYHKDNAHKWLQSDGHHGRSFYVLILNTSKWPAGAVHGRAGQGMVHDYIFHKLCAESFQKNTACCGGFAIMGGTVKFSSKWLNMTSNNTQSNSWQSDGAKELSLGEQAVVCHVISQWICKGPNTNVVIGQTDCPIERIILYGDSPAAQVVKDVPDAVTDTGTARDVLPPAYQHTSGDAAVRGERPPLPPRAAGMTITLPSMARVQASMMTALDTSIKIARFYGAVAEATGANEWMRGQANEAVQGICGCSIS